ncbi:MAG: hypothetical protein QM527_11400 [Alphaproteobacteria bacterium]|nr:hypothetical protein [Alphaproteobacteria bacterium]
MELDLRQFFQMLGVERVLTDGEVLTFPSGLKLWANDTGWTVLASHRTCDEANMTQLMNLCQSHLGLVPFCSRSGHPGLKWHAMHFHDSTTQGAQILSAITQAYE